MSSGLIAFCDILGYRSFLKNNSAEDACTKVLDIINEAPSKTKETVHNELSSWDTSALGLNELEHYVFSDSIVLTLEIPDESDLSIWMNRFFHFTAVTTMLQKNMFDNGLPLRSVVHQGEYFVRENSLAGKGIVEAYDLVENLNLSTIANSKSIETKLEEITDGNEFPAGHFLVKYLTPLKNGAEVPLYNSNWIAGYEEDVLATIKGDVESYVLKSFWAHSKDCAISVDIKIANTAKLIRRMLLAIEDSEESKEKENGKEHE